MNINEVSQLINGKKGINQKSNKSKQKLENRNSIISFLRKNQEYMLVIVGIIIILIIFLVIYIIFNTIKNNPMNIYLNLLEKNPYPQILKSNDSNRYDKSLLDEKKICSQNKKFAILRRTNCQACGLFSYYIVHIGCIINFLQQGYIPILEVSSFSNIFTGNNIMQKNPWEEFFNQPCGYTFEKVVNMKNVTIFECQCVGHMPDEKTIYSNKIMWDYHHQIQEKYMSVKNIIYKEAEKIWKKLFGESKNVLGILLRGTDYTALKPFEHAKPPSVERALSDTIKMNNKNNYDFIFLGTEDNIIRDNFIKKFGDKLKYLLPKKQVFYDYEDQNYLTYNSNVYGNMDFMKTYLLTVVILSKCLDIISVRTSGAAGVFILSKGFRNSLVYYIGYYKADFYFNE